MGDHPGFSFVRTRRRLRVVVGLDQQFTFERDIVELVTLYFEHPAGHAFRGLAQGLIRVITGFDGQPGEFAPVLLNRLDRDDAAVDQRVPRLCPAGRGQGCIRWQHILQAQVLQYPADTGEIGALGLLAIRQGV